MLLVFYLSCLRSLTIGVEHGIGDKAPMATPKPELIDLSKICLNFHNCCPPFFICLFKLLFFEKKNYFKQVSTC